MTQHRRIHWTTPATILLAFFAGILLAVGHHLFYKRLAGHVAPPGQYHLPFGEVSKQQVNTAVGTAFAFLVKSMLSLAVAASFTQVFWRALITAEKGARLADVDTAFSVLQDFSGLFKTSVWRRHSLLLPLAVIFWLIPIPAVITPGTLSVQSALVQPIISSMTAVPQFDFSNLNLFNLGIIGDGFFSYAGPSRLAQRIAAATAAQGEILPITPPNLNTSWSLEFWGPSIQCNNVSASQRMAILDNYGSYLNTNVQLSYFSWTAYNVLPFTNDSGTMTLSAITPSVNGSAAVFLAFDGDPQGLPISIEGGTTLPWGNWSEIVRNVTVLRCDLFNSSYNLDFQYTNGAQSIAVSKTNASQDTPITAEEDFYFPMAPNEVWNATASNGSDSIHRTCFEQSCAMKVSYQGIFDAFNGLLYGSIQAFTELSESFITQTVLTETDELQFLYNQQNVANALFDSPYFQSRPTTPLLGSRGPLGNALEQLFENITISILSEPYLQPNYSAAGAPSPLANVTFETYHNIYAYDSVTLWIAYGVAILVTALAAVIGSTAMWMNGVAYDANFSTVLRTSRIVRTVAEHDKGASGSSWDSEDGSRPLPKPLEKAIIIMTAAENKRCSNEEMLLKPKNGVVVGEHAEAVDDSLLAGQR